MKKVLVTGGAGFVGVHLIEQILKTTDWEVTSLDRYDTSGNPNRLADMLESTTGIDKTRVKIVFWDLKAALNEQVQNQLNGPFDYILHLAAGSHVDRSIEDPISFFNDNCIGTLNLLEYVRRGRAKEDECRFVYFSTDEVYGPYPMEENGGFKEWDRLNPNNPYAAAKAAAEMAVISYANTYRIPCVITNAMNIFGERQHTEKFIPMLIKRSISGEKIFIHADKTKTQAGKRHYIHARNVSAATLWVAQNGQLLDGSAKQGRYNIVGEIEMDNLQVANLIHDLVKEIKPEIPDLNYELVDFHGSRPGHDLKYALDGQLLKDQGFQFNVAFEESLRNMVRWTLQNSRWL